MSEYIKYLVILGVTFQLLGVISYIKETLRGNTKPNKVTWLLWAIAPLIATLAAFSDGVRWAVLPVFMSGFGPLLIFIASFINKDSYWKLQKFDYVCGFFSLLALVLWLITKDAVIAISFAILSDAAAGIPTIVKSWKYPETENVAPFAAGLFSSLTSFAAIKTWNFSSYAFPTYLIIVGVIIIFALNRKKIYN